MESYTYYLDRMRTYTESPEKLDDKALEEFQVLVRIGMHFLRIVGDDKDGCEVGCWEAEDKLWELYMQGEREAINRNRSRKKR